MLGAGRAGRGGRTIRIQIRDSAKRFLSRWTLGCSRRPEIQISLEEKSKANKGIEGEEKKSDAVCFAFVLSRGLGCLGGTNEVLLLKKAERKRERREKKVVERKRKMQGWVGG